MHDYVQSVISVIQTAVFLWIVARHTKHLDKNEKVLEHLSNRDDYQDDAISMLGGKRFKSSRIVNGVEDFPNFKPAGREQ